MYLVMSLDGKVDSQRLARIARLIVRAEPVLGCRFVPHPFRPYWERREDLDQVELFKFVESVDVEGVIREFVSSHLDPSRDPQFRLLLVRADTDTLCLGVNHMCSDGAGLVKLAYLVASTYLRLHEDPFLCLSPNLTDRSYRQLGKKLKLKGKLAIIGNGIHTFRTLRHSGKWKIPPVSVGQFRPDYDVLNIASDHVRAISHFARSNRVPLGVVLITATFRALRNIVPHTEDLPLPFFVPFDLRTFLPSGQDDAIRHFSSGTLLLASPNRKSEFSDDLAAFRAQVKAKNRPYSGIVSPLLIAETLQPINSLLHIMPFYLTQALYHRSIRSMKHGESNAVGMSFADVNSDRMRFDDVGVRHAYVLGNVPKMPGFLHFAAVRTRDSLSFSTCWFENSLSRSLVESILKQIVQELPQ